ncbi:MULTISPECIES: GNAT family N-acetyltransferase [Vibrio]|uniref:N-acetyltransferase n=1 Tax=Vibrio casei TaxID=673372 RepID=A0A368LFL6_9VIBR|nr:MULTISPECIES: GNAT family N-acetyltransferase [Vibrio]RCS68221.1 N-acetyltransferase [Vibrio casei]HBV76073.1 N-acetyltransferase [Vibrio sp.]
MSELTFQELEPIKLPLIKSIYKAFYPSAKPKKTDTIIVGYLEHEIIAIVRFRPIDNVNLLTGMLVIPKYRLSGVAQKLLQFCQSGYLTDSCYCFAYPHLKNFYLTAGFKVRKTEDLPAPLQQLFSRYTSNGKNLLPMQYKYQDMA